MMLLQTTTQTDQTFGMIGNTLLIGTLITYILLVINAFFSALFSSTTAGMKLVWIVFIMITPFINNLL